MRLCVPTLIRLAAWLSLGAIAGWIFFGKVDPGSAGSDLDGVLIGGFMGFVVSRWFNR